MLTDHRILTNHGYRMKALKSQAEVIQIYRNRNVHVTGQANAMDRSIRFLKVEVAVSEC
jgi:hypothetical protein